MRCLFLIRQEERSPGRQRYATISRRRASQTPRKVAIDDGELDIH